MNKVCLLLVHLALRETLVSLEEKENEEELEIEVLMVSKVYRDIQEKKETKENQGKY